MVSASITDRLQRMTVVIKKRSMRSFAWMLVGQGLGYCFQAVYFVILTRLLGPVEYGIFVGAFAYTSLFAPYSSLGTGTLFLRYASDHPELVAKYWGNILLSSISLSAFFIPILVLLGHLALSPSSAHLVFLAAIANCLCAQVVTECARMFQSAEKMHLAATLSLITSASRVLAALAMLYLLHRATSWQWTIASTAISIVSLGVVMIAVYCCFGAPQFDLHLLRIRALEGLGFSFASSSSSISNDIDKTMLSHYGLNHANGIYTTAYRIIDFATMPTYALREASIPRLFRSAREGIEPPIALGYCLLKRSGILSSFAFLALVLSAPLLPIVVGRDFAESIAAIRWLAFIPVFRSIHQMTGSVLLVTGYQKYRTANQIFVAVFNMLANLWAIPHYGWRGAAWTSLATDGVLAIANLTMLQIIRQRAVTAVIGRKMGANNRI